MFGYPAGTPKKMCVLTWPNGFEISIAVHPDEIVIPLEKTGIPAKGMDPGLSPGSEKVKLQLGSRCLRPTKLVFSTYRSRLLMI